MFKETQLNIEYLINDLETNFKVPAVYYSVSKKSIIAGNKLYWAKIEESK